MGLMLLIGRESIQTMPLQDAMYRGTSDLDAMEPVQIRGNAGRPEVVVLAQIQDLADDLPRRRAGRALRRTGSIPEASVAVLGVSPFPLVERFPRDSKPTADSRDILLVRRLL
jgi:hypothetical protein